MKTRLNPFESRLHNLPTPDEVRRKVAIIRNGLLSLFVTDRSSIAVGLTLAFACLAVVPPVWAATEYPVLDTKYAYAQARHAGETRVGSVGIINKYTNSSLATLAPAWTSVAGQSRGVLRFNYEFRAVDQEEFAGFFLTFGRIAVDTVLTNGVQGPTVDLHTDGTFNLDDLASTGTSTVSIESLRLRLRQNPPFESLKIRVELEDKNGRKGAVRLIFTASDSTPATFDIPLTSFGGSFDRTAVKLLAAVIEENHFLDNVHNPPSGNFDVLGIWLVDGDGPAADAATIAQLDNISFVRALAYRDFETLWRLVDAKTGATLDRTLFRDLIHWGSTGWLLAALPFAIQQAWVSPAEAEARALKILRFADDPSLYGDEPAGRLGNSRGILYRFAGIDPAGLSGPLTGTRKIDVGNVNAVEASVIDTAIFQLGAATCAAGFTNGTANQTEIRTRATSILRRTRWSEIVDLGTGQLYQAWKPQIYSSNNVYFTTPAAFGGFWASRDAVGTPLTIDYWTAEGAMAALLAVGSETYPISAAIWYSMFREARQVAGQSVVVTYPGAWFTYAFLPTIYLDPTLGQDRGAEYGVAATDWIVNTRRAFEGYRALATPSSLPLPDATELPNIQYVAQGLPALAIDSAARFTGTVTPYSLQMAIGLGGTNAAAAIAELKRILGDLPEIWDPLVGLLDSFHTNLAAFTPQTNLVRTTGPWVQQQKWPLDCGAALLAELNYLDNGVVWRTANRHSVIATAVNRIYRQPRTGVNRFVTLGAGGHDWWSTAISRNTVIFPDSFQEVIHFYDTDGAFLGQTSYSDIGAALAAAGISVERSGGPAGLRDAAVLPPDGDFVVLVAGPGADALLRVSTNRTVSVLAHSFGEAMNRGDEIWNFPRVAAGGVPPAILVTIQSPIQGVAILGLDGTLLRQLNLGALYYGLAVEPATNRLYLLRSGGVIQRYDNFTVPGLTPTTVAMLPAGVIGRDLAWTTLWRTDRPALIVSADNGRLYSIDPTAGTVVLIDDAALTGVVGVDIAGTRAVFAGDETGLLNDLVICSYNVVPMAVIAPATGLTTNLLVTAPTECTWAVNGVDSWFSATPTTNSGTGTVTLVVNVNTSTNARSTQFVIADIAISVMQMGTAPDTNPPCSLTLSTASFVVSAHASTNSVEISSETANCIWAVQNTNAWISVQPNSGTGNQTVSVVVTPNESSEERKATLMLNSATLFVYQIAAASGMRCLSSVSNEVDHALAEFNGIGSLTRRQKVLKQKLTAAKNLLTATSALGLEHDVRLFRKVAILLRSLSNSAVDTAMADAGSCVTSSLAVRLTDATVRLNTSPDSKAKAKIGRRLQAVGEALQAADTATSSGGRSAKLSLALTRLQAAERSLGRLAQ